MTEKQLGNVTIQNTRLIFRNFSGKEGRFNRAGDRNTNVLIDFDTAKAMEADGWPVKWLQPREEGDLPQGHIQVKVKYGKGRPPRVVLVTSRGRQQLDEEDLNILDWADIRYVDIIVRPYQWEQPDGRTGISAYVQSLFVNIEEDELEKKYADIPDAPDSAQNTVRPGRPDMDDPPWN